MRATAACIYLFGLLLIYFEENVQAKNKFRTSLAKAKNRKLASTFELDSSYLPGPIESFDVGEWHVCVLTVQKEVICWGATNVGQTGHGSVSYSESALAPPINLGTGRVAKDIQLGGWTTYILDESDDVVSVGHNAMGQLGQGISVFSNSAVGNAFVPLNFGTGRKVKKIQGAHEYACVILDDDTLKCFGDSSKGQLGYGTYSIRGKSAATMGNNLPAVDLGDGEVIKDISVGRLHACALLEGNKAKCWGDNEFGQLGYGDLTIRPSPGPLLDLGRPIIDIQAGDHITCALLDDGGVKCFGKNNFGQLCLGHGDNVGGNADDVGNNLPYAKLGSGIIVKRLFVHGESPCALLEDDRVKCWGENDYCAAGVEKNGHIGLTEDTIGDKLAAIDLGGKTIKKLAGMFQSKFAILSNDIFTAWGRNNGVFGTGDKSSKGCNEGDMGGNLPIVTTQCNKHELLIDINTEEHSSHASVQLMDLSKNTLAMKAREGYYTMEAQTYKHDLCVPDGTYEFKIEHSLGNWSGSYEVRFKGNLIYDQNPQGYLWQDQHTFSSCSALEHCDDLFSCTYGACNVATSQCEFSPTFSDSCRTYGAPKALVIRSLTSDSNTTSTRDELITRFYGSGEHLSMRSQFLACSYERFDLVPFSGVTTSSVEVYNGTIDIFIEENTIGKPASTVSSKVLEKAANELGELSNQFDFVIVCLPPGVIVGDSSSWKAYAFVNGYISIYNDLNCIYPSVQMHEIGHNLGLSHSNDEENYGDTSGAMGISYSLLDGPAKCFNAPKSLQLKWYRYGDLTLDIATLIGKEVHLVGVSDYLERGFKSTHLKIINCQDGFDYFLAFNRKTKINSGTTEGEDQILLSRRRVGDYYDDSTLVAKLEHLQQYTVRGLGPDGNWDLQIMPNIYLDENPSYGRVSFSVLTQQCLAEENCDDNNYCTNDECNVLHGEMVCSHTPRSCSDCGAPLFLEVTTNDYPYEILWDIQNVHTKRIVKSSTYYTDEFTSYNFSECFEFGMYIFSIYYTNSTDNFYQNASFKLFISDEELDNGNITEMMYAETIFTICTKDSDCLDYDGCTIDTCDMETRLCNNSYIPLNEECRDCFWAYFNLTTDNFAEETKWNVYDVETGLLVESGDPYPSYFHAFGRRKAPTKSGRRKAPTKSGRRKAPTKSGRRKAPTRSSALNSVKVSSRNLDEDEDNEIFKAICMETNIKYKFVITDSFGDGICCAEGEGFFAVTLEDKVIKKGGNFSSFDEISFKFSISEASCEDNDPGTRYEYDPAINACLYYPVVCSEYGAMTTVLIKSDIYADDTIWKVIGNNTVEMEGGMYDLAYSIYENKKCLPYGSYTFSIVDPPADGMAFCFENECGYELSVNNRTIAISDGSFGTGRDTLLVICASDEECNDYDTCTVDTCDLENKVCIFQELSCSECSKETVVVDVNTDILFSLTSWNIIETQSNTSVGSAGPFVKSYTNYKKLICLLPGTYVFTIRNSEGRGMTICRSDLECGYSVTVNNETIIDSDGSFEFEKSHSFTICDTEIDCEDDDPCSVGQCRSQSKLCRFDKVPCSSCDRKGLKIIVDTDRNAPETSWNLMDSLTKQQITSGGKYVKNYNQYVYDECVPKGQYVYSIFDEGGNGLTSCSGNGTTCGYSIFIDDEIILDSPGNFGSVQSHAFKLCDNETNATGCNKITSTYIPQPSPTATSSTAHIEYLEIQTFATGYYHTCALTKKQLIFCWGDNSFGQLGYGDKINRAKTGSLRHSVDLGEITTAKQIHAGAFHTCIVTIEEDAVCWGDNSFGQLGIGSTSNIGSSDGQMGNALKRVDVGLGRKVRKLSLGYQHSCALLDNYIIKCWGNNEFGQLGIGNLDKIGDDQYEMGNNLTVIELGSYEIVEDISAGSHHTCAIQAFEVRCWGKNSNGQLGYGDKVNRGGTVHSMGTNLPVVNVGATPVKLTAGNSVTCIITSDGKSKCFGYNKFGQLGYGDKMERGGIQANMGEALPYIDIGDNQNITYLTRGSYSMCALLNDNSVKCWGFGLECSLGLGDDRDRFSTEDMGNNLPYVDLGGKRVKEIQMYHWHGCALFEDNKLSCWGFNRNGQLGNGLHKNIGCNPEEMGENLVPVNISDSSPFVGRVDSVSEIELNQGISIQYNVSKSFTLSKFTSFIYDKTCTFKANTTSISVKKYEFEQKRYESLDKAIVTVDVDYQSIRSSQFWSDISISEGAYEFCIVSEIYFDETKSDTISISETIISSHVNFDGNFNIISMHVSKMDAIDLHEGSHFQMKACLCNIDHVCDEKPIIHQDADIMLCVHPHDELRVTKFQNVNFYQDGILKFKAVENGKGKLLTTTAIEGEYGVLQTRLVADFFRTPNPSAAHVIGEVYLDFRDHVGGRSLSGNTQASFRLNIFLKNEKATSNIGFHNFVVMIFVSFAGYIFVRRDKKSTYSYSLLENREI